jgi:hypothetical protein
MSAIATGYGTSALNQKKKTKFEIALNAGPKITQKAKSPKAGARH